MEDFLAVLVFLESTLVRILSVRFPLGSDFSISYGSIVFSLIFLPFLFKILLKLFGFDRGDKK